MSIVETTQCSGYDHPEFRFAVDTRQLIDVDVQFLRTTLEGWVAAGERFAAGETIQLGSGVLMIRANGDGTLSLLEPDFASMPIQWRDSVTTTLGHFRLQKDTLESFFDPGQLAFPSVRHSCVACTRLDATANLVMERSEWSAPSTGWFIGCSDESHDHNSPAELELVSIYEALLRNSAALPYLAFPLGTLLQTGAPPFVFFGGKPLAARPGSFVADALARGAAPSPAPRRGKPSSRLN